MNDLNRELFLLVLFASKLCLAQDANDFPRQHPIVPVPSLAQHLEGFNVPLNSEFLADTTRRILWRPLDAATVGVQALAALGVGGIVVGGTIGLTHEMTDPYGKAAVYFLASAIGAASVPLSIEVSGNWMGGNGDGVWTCVGAAAGASVAVVLVALPGSTSGETIFADVVIAGILGGIIGYHASSSTVYETTKNSVTIRLSNKVEANLFPAVSQRFGRVEICVGVISASL